MTDKKPKKEKKIDPKDQKISELSSTVVALRAESDEWHGIADLNTDKLNLLHDALFTHTQALLIQKIIVSSELLIEPIKLELLSKILGLTPTYNENDNEGVEYVDENNTDYN